MKIIRMSMAAFVAGLVVLSVVTPCQAQSVDLSLGVRRWFKVSISSLGYCPEKDFLSANAEDHGLYP